MMFHAKKSFMHKKNSKKNLKVKFFILIISYLYTFICKNRCITIFVIHGIQSKPHAELKPKQTKKLMGITHLTQIRNLMTLNWTWINGPDVSSGLDMDRISETNPAQN